MVDLKELQKEVMRNKVEKGFNTNNTALEFCRAYEELSEAFSKHNKNDMFQSRDSFCKSFIGILQKTCRRKTFLSKKHNFSAMRHKTGLRE